MKLLCLDASNTSPHLLNGGIYTLKSKIQDEFGKETLCFLREFPGFTYHLSRFKEMEDALPGKDPLDQPNRSDVGIRDGPKAKHLNVNVITPTSRRWISKRWDFTSALVTRYSVSSTIIPGLTNVSSCRNS